MNSTSRKRSTRPHRKQSTTPRIPYGYCHCGCGQKTWIATTNDKHWGHIKGEPVRFCHGHHSRIHPSERFSRKRVITVEGVRCAVFRVRDGTTVKVDVSDFATVSDICWYGKRDGDGKLVSIHCNLNGGTDMHTMILGKAPRGMDIDHFNGDVRDNRRRNLRIANRSQSMANVRKRRGTMSMYRGVTLGNPSQRWLAQITVNYHHFYLGSFNHQIDAARVYDAKAREFFGEFACVNFPEIGERSALSGKIRRR